MQAHMLAYKACVFSSVWRDRMFEFLRIGFRRRIDVSPQISSLVPFLAVLPSQDGIHNVAFTTLLISNIDTFCIVIVRLK
jgi:hypothetical protein